jgi:hypothetical protein
MSDIAQKGEVAILEKVFELQDALAEAKVRLEAVQAEQERDKSMTVTIDQPPVDLTPVIDALESLKEALPTIPESKEVDMTPVVSALQDLQNTLALDNQYPEHKDYTEHFTALLEALSKPTLEKEILEALSRPYPEFSIPTNIISSDGRIKVEVDKVGGNGSSRVADVRGVAVNPATSEKQDTIIAHLPLNDENRVKVSTLPGMPEACSGVLTTTVAAATDITGTGCVGGTGYIAVDVSRASNVMFSLQNTGGTNMAAGQFAIEASLDSTNGTDGTWIAIQAVRSNANTIVTNTGTLTANAGAGGGFGFEASVNANMWFRLRVTTNVTAGAQAKWTILRGSYATEPIPAAQTHAVTMTTTTIGGSASVGGQTLFRNVALSNTDVAIKATAGRVYSWYFKNPDASATAWVHFYNATIANVVVGTTVPVWSVEVPAGIAKEIAFTIPMTFATAITLAATTSYDHTVSTAPTTALVAFVGYI